MKSIHIRFAYDGIVKSDAKTETAKFITQAIEKNPGLSIDKLKDMVLKGDALKNAFAIDF